MAHPFTEVASAFLEVLWFATWTLGAAFFVRLSFVYGQTGHRRLSDIWFLAGCIYVLYGVGLLLWATL